MRINIASRKSDLARLQAYMVGAALKKHHSNIEIKYHFSSSLGDQNQGDPLWKMPTQGVFTQDFRFDLIQGNIDMVVHSWKDLPTQMDENTILAATLPRADHRDLLLVKKTAIKGVKETKQLRLLSSSPRRMFNLHGFLKNAFPNGLKDVIFEDVRGNIQTRLDKLLKLEVDGLIVAKAAIDRLLSASQYNQVDDNFDQSANKIYQAIKQCEWMVLPASVNPPAAAQGALVVEIASKRNDLAKILSAINCTKTFNDVQKERQILSSYGGGCHQKIGVWVSTIEQGRVVSTQGESEAGESLKSFTLESNKQLPNNVKSQEIFNPKQLGDLFTRTPIPVNAQSIEKMADADVLLLASSHIPDEYLLAIKDQAIWASGVASWFKLAKKNIWVNGVDDNLGGFCDRNLQFLLGKNSLNWLTLTHEDSPSTPAIATYKLLPNNSDIELNNEKYFYWRSGSAFKRAIELKPEILNAIHSCGLGHTYKIISSIVGEKGRVFPFVNEEDWLDQISK